LVNGFKCSSPVIKAERICPVTKNWLVWLAQVVLAGIVQDWPADKFFKVYEICFSDIVGTGAVAGRNSVQMVPKV